MRKTVLRKRIFIVEDHPVFRQGLAEVINAERDMAVCGEADSAEEALTAIQRIQPDLVVIDLTLPGKSGLELIRELRAKDSAVKLLVVSMHDEAIYADRVLRAGGNGYIMKQEDPEEIIHAIRDVLSGHIYVSEDVLASRGTGTRKRNPSVESRPLEDLTDQELEIMEALGQGKSEQEIARLLGIRSALVNSHCARIRKKLKLKSTNALIRYAVCWIDAHVR